MADFHETSAAKAYSTIDTAGWLFVAFVVGITAVAAMLAYNGSDTLIAQTASQVASPHG
jgi:hypothetical protein